MSLQSYILRVEGGLAKEVTVLGADGKAFFNVVIPDEIQSVEGDILPAVEAIVNALPALAGGTAAFGAAAIAGLTPIAVKALASAEAEAPAAVAAGVAAAAPEIAADSQS